MVICGLEEGILMHPGAFEKAMDYSLGEFWIPFICFREGHLVAKEGIEDILDKAVNRFKKTHTTESFCSSVKNALSSLSSVFDKEAGMFTYTALVLRYLHVIEGLEENELTEIGQSMSLC